MNVLPEKTFLGKLEFIEIYDYFDFPCCFSLKNNLGQYFITSLVEINEDYFKWFYLQISYERLELLHSNKLTLNKAFKSSETNSIFSISLMNNTNEFKIDILNSEIIPASLLPSEDSYIKG